MNADTFNWWSSLNHGGLLIAPARLSQFFPETIRLLPQYKVEHLRRALTRAASNDYDSLLDTVLEEICELPAEQWVKGSQVGREWSYRTITGSTLKPRRVWRSASGTVLPFFVDMGVSRMGIGAGRRETSRVIEWLRKANQSIALFTNGRQWRLIHAGTDYDAWTEWDSSFWFVEGKPSPQIDALRILLGCAALTAGTAGQDPPLIAAIQASRQGQAEISAVLGERVRQAVELLIKEVGASIETTIRTANVTPSDLYVAATRVIMRCVIVLFAEARDLLPRDNTIYHGSYGIQGLREQLDRIGGGRSQDRLRHSYSAWPRLLALFRLIHGGSPHEALPVPAYGGRLFAPADVNAKSGVDRAMTIFEDLRTCPSDAAVHRVLNLLTRSKIKVKQGHHNTWVDASVDFSDLSSEYVGILYQSLLGFELRQAAPDSPSVFLNLGDQPALPITRLEAMSEEALASLVAKLKERGKATPGGEEAEAQEASEDEAGTAEDEPESDEAEAVEEEEPLAAHDTSRQVQERVLAWATRAVKAAGLVGKPAGKTKTAADKWDAEVQTRATRLIAHTILPGEWFLVRWGGTRKGAGTFYTRPQLGIPLVHRTLRPLCYDKIGGQLIPKKPEVILALKIGDSAMGSGSLLLGALRYLTDALYESLYYHDRISVHGDQSLCRLADGHSADILLDETLPVRPDHPEFEERLRARLKRYIVEGCIYGVDLDPLAVELAKLSLWIETMDPRLPFEFLDHKLKWGNSLVGCWFDRFQDYPVMAWEREGGDENHERFVHHYREYTSTSGKQRGRVVRKGDKWAQAIKDIKNDLVKPQMRSWIVAQDNLPFEFARSGHTAVGLHDEASSVFEELHTIPVHETARKGTLYQDKITDNPSLLQLKLAFDTWCAIWFWPGDELALIPTPENFHAPPAETVTLVQRLAEQMRFFHWELEFPDVFCGPGTGFDAMLQNPPWDILKPKSQEFFSNIDPLYRGYGKQVALAQQEEYFAQNPSVERDWLDYCARFRALSNWCKHAAFPFGDDQEGGDHFSFSRSTEENLTLHGSWRRKRRTRVGYADPEHPFRHQGSADVNTYKMFLELTHALLHHGGRMGVIVPSGLYTDKGSSDLRTLFLDRCRWEWLFGFINWNKIFDAVYYRFKFCLTIMQKGDKTEYINSAFSRYHIQEWEEAERYIIPYSRNQVAQFSPRSQAILETRTLRDLDILAKVYANCITFGDDSPERWGIEYTSEFHMTGDSKLFPPLPTWEHKGYRPDEYGHWLKGSWEPFIGNPSILDRPVGQILSRDGQSFIESSAVEDIALPLYQGRMIGQFDFSQKGWVSGVGRTAVWREIPWQHKVIAPQYLMARNTYMTEMHRHRDLKILMMDITSATNARTTIAAVINDLPAGHNTPRLVPKKDSVPAILAAALVMNSVSWDVIVRARLGGQSLSWNVLEETALPKMVFEESSERLLATVSARLALPSIHYSPTWLRCRNLLTLTQPWKTLWALSEYERLRLRSIADAICASIYSLSTEDFAWILRDTDHPAFQMTDREFYRTLDPKGFWRVDKDRNPELRHTVLAQVAFDDLQEKGLTSFLAQNDGEGWMIPETLRLADYGLGHDQRAKEHQPVASRLGPRFLDWQLNQSAEESWAECERHAANVRFLQNWGKPAHAETHSEAMPGRVPTPEADTRAHDQLFQPDLFGDRPRQLGLFDAADE